MLNESICITMRLVCIAAVLASSSSFTVVPHLHHVSSKSSSALNLVGIFFGSSTGSTEEAAELIKSEFGDDAEGPIEIDEIQGSVAEQFAKYDALVVGTPTWNTGADTERSGVGWDEIYYGEMQDLQLAGKKVAVFGLGDSISYSENYADASGELHDVFEKLGAQMMGYTSQEGYEHDDSKAIRGDLFCGLLLDAVNFEDLTEDRVKNWVAQLKEEGIMETTGTVNGATAVMAATPVAAPAAATETVSADDAVARLERENAELRALLQENPGVFKEASSGETVANPEGFKPYTNKTTGQTMWVSSDGRSCYYTMASTSNFSP